MTLTQFANALLAALGMPQSTNNIQSIVSAQAIEGGFMHNSARYNPLNTTQVMPGSVTVGASGGPAIQAYTDWTQGLQAIVKTLQNGYYNDILSSLRASAAPDDTLRVWQLNPMYGWYDCVDPKTGTKYPPGVCPAGSTKVPNPIKTSAEYQAQANESYPDGSSGAGSYPVPQVAPGAGSMSPPIVRLGLLGVLGYALYKLLPTILK